VASESERSKFASPRNDAALEGIRRLVARYRAQPEQLDLGAERRDSQISRPEPDADRSAVTVAP
jgi:hypothetical protein